MKINKDISGFEAAVIGVSAGGFVALTTIIALLPDNFALPIIIVQHRHPHSDNYLIQTLDERCKRTVKEAEEKEKIEPGVVYIAPVDYHLLIEDERIFSLSNEKRIRYSRPSIDVLFESAADVYGSKLIGIILTGANNDGSSGLKRIKERGGLAIVQDYKTADSEYMPKAALAATTVDHILSLDQIGSFLAQVTCSKVTKRTTGESGS